MIDDSYNSNPVALARALELLGGERQARRCIAVVGEMLELGERSTALHEECGRAAAPLVDRLGTGGGEPARALGRAAVEGGLPEAAVRHAATSLEATDVVAHLVAPGDLVLVKGSRGIRTELVVARLAAEFA